MKSLLGVWLSTALIGALVPLSADAQPACFELARSATRTLQEGLRQGLRDLGYVEGRNITVEARWSDGSPDRLPALRASWRR